MALTQQLLRALSFLLATRGHSMGTRNTSGLSGTITEVLNYLAKLKELDFKAVSVNSDENAVVGRTFVAGVYVIPAPVGNAACRPLRP